MGKKIRAEVAVVGIGASAGGLEALEALFAGLPPKLPAAFVVVQHLEPTHRDLLVDLLKRSTAMPVSPARHRARVEAGQVYVMPPGRALELRGGALWLSKPAAPRGHRAPIDGFFRSLAEALQARAIGVVLSGMGSDGTLGLGQIKEKGGATLVQTLATARSDAMPRSAIEAGFADVVAAPAELGPRIAALLAHPLPRAEPPPALDAELTRGLDALCTQLREQTGHDFSQYRRTSLLRRVERRMRLHQLDALPDYTRLVRKSSDEAELLFKELLIGVTSFFRDPRSWVTLAKKVWPALLRELPREAVLRAWVPACSTGEEAYSLAMTFAEAQRGRARSGRPRLQVFATDLDRDAIERARAGLYPKVIASQVSRPRLARFFTEEKQGFRVRPELREMIVFAPQNVLHDPPFTRLDVVSCRNLLIYLEPAIQKTVLAMFHYCLNPGGVLFLGNAETASAVGSSFAQLDASARLWRKRAGAPAGGLTELLPSRTRAPHARNLDATSEAEPALQELADRMLFERYGPSAVLTTPQGDIVYISGRTGRYLEPAAGKANWNIHAMAREGVRHELIAAFQLAVREGRTVIRGPVPLDPEGSAQAVTLTIEPLRDPKGLSGMVAIVFRDTTLPAKARRGQGRGSGAATVARLGHELNLAVDELRLTREQMQSSQEQLKSANEELQSTNEELQSTNEELTTSKEEMQSMNEELQTLNQQLQAKVDELSRTHDDMRNLLDNTDIATVLLDGALNVRRYTPQATRIIKLIPGDVDRPIADLASTLLDIDLVTEARAVLADLVPRQLEAKSADGRWFSVRVMPYHTQDNRIDGVVLTFVDVTTAKTLEARLRDASRGD
ncbi:MAG: PAS domain-containing protein [Archangiaceae bacterium]|nr:PAS domain-containing protein [Archangiaceae bacterium]